MCCKKYFGQTIQMFDGVGTRSVSDTNSLLPETAL